MVADGLVSFYLNLLDSIFLNLVVVLLPFTQRSLRLHYKPKVELNPNGDIG